MKILIALVLLASALIGSAQTTSHFKMTNDAPRLLLSGAKIVDNVVVLNTNATTAVLRFYDNSTGATSIVRAAYTRYQSIATNFNQIFTNEANVLVTNTFIGVYRAPVAVAAITNERPVLRTIAVPASTTLERALDLQTMLGLVVLSDKTLDILIDHRNQ